MMDTSFSETWTTCPNARKRLREDHFEPADSFNVPMPTNSQDKNATHFALPTTGSCFAKLTDTSPQLTRPIHPLPSKFASSKLRHPHRNTSAHANIHSAAPPFLISRVASRTSPKHKRARPSSSDGNTPHTSSSLSQKMQLSPEFSHSALPCSVPKSTLPYTATTPPTPVIRVNPNHRCHICNRVHMLGLLNFSSEFTNCEACSQPTCGICVRECVSCDEKVCSRCSQEKGEHTFCHACAALNRKWSMIS